MKVVERVFEKRFRRIVYVNEVQFGFMPERGTIDAVFILRRMQEEYHAIGCMCFVDLEKAFDRLPRKALDWVLLLKKGIQVLVRSVMSLYERAEIGVRVDSELSGEFEVKVVIH